MPLVNATNRHRVCRRYTYRQECLAVVNNGGGCECRSQREMKPSHPPPTANEHISHQLSLQSRRSHVGIWTHMPESAVGLGRGIYQGSGFRGSCLRGLLAWRGSGADGREGGELLRPAGVSSVRDTCVCVCVCVCARARIDAC